MHKTLLGLILSVWSFLAVAETDPTYIHQHAINASESTFDDLLIERLKPYRVIMLGEVHGTSEFPEFALDLVKNLANSGKKITLALEIPANFQGAITAAIENKDLATLAASDFFRSKYQDGRSSLAMAMLILAASEHADILCFDKSWSLNSPDRDLEMAKNITTYAHQHPENTIVLLAGNWHTQVIDHVAPSQMTPMGYYLSHVGEHPIDQDNILTIMGRSDRGSEWVCYTTNADECGVKRHRGSKQNYASAVDWWRYFLFEPTLQDGHDATLFVRTTSASGPLQTEFDFLKECKISPQHIDLLMEQTFWTFDQSDFGHRYLYRSPKLCKTTSAALIDSYLLTRLSSLLPSQSRILYFHSGQDYAMADIYGLAIQRFRNAFNPEEATNPNFHWNAYVSATIAFLSRDKTALIEARSRFPEDPQGGDAMNVKVIDRFIKCFESSYLEAYSGSGSCKK